MYSWHGNNWQSRIYKVPACCFCGCFTSRAIIDEEGKSLPCSPEGFIEVAQNLVRMGCLGPEPLQKQCRKTYW